MKGWVGKILRIDLSKGSCLTEELPFELAKQFIGGRGLGVKILSDEVDPKVEPLSPENKLIFITGPLTGTSAVCASRYMVVTKSPLTGAIACANLGGYFGSELKFSGYDAVIIESKSPKPVYLSIMDDKVEILPAADMWGKTVSETEEMIKAKVKSDRIEINATWLARDTFIASIGPAGEKLVKFASIVSDKHEGGSGSGAVMGSKNLKAIAVRGTRGIIVGEHFERAVTDSLEKLKESSYISEMLANFGTSSLTEVLASMDILPYKNFQHYLEDVENLSGEAINEAVGGERRSCRFCPIACTRLVKIDKPEFKNCFCPDYEAIGSFGGNCGIKNPVAITKANCLCHELGIDTISTAGTIACAMELYERGILSQDELGLDLNFGNSEAVIELLPKIASREGFGDILAEGGYILAQKYRHPEAFMGVKKQEMPPYDPGNIKGLGLGFATSNWGASHAAAYTIIEEVLSVHEEADPLKVEGKADLIKRFQDITAASDSTGLCFLALMGIWVDEIYNMLGNALWDDPQEAGYAVEDLVITGERIWNLERIFNLKAGLEKDDDTLPRRFLDGEDARQVCELDQMLPEYYRIRGWDENGIPTEEKLTELGLGESNGKNKSTSK
jgi:aldehyde:ferredoxin oxidoreductase